MIKITSIPWITHTHNDCNDLWRPYIGEMNKYMPYTFDKFKHIYMVDMNKLDLAEEIFKGQVHYYDDKIAYPSRLIKLLETLIEEGHEYAIIDHEDMFIFDYPKLMVINDAFNIMQKENIDSIKLSRSTNCIASSSKICKDLMHISNESEWIFSVQPSIWRVRSYLNLLKQNPNVNIWELETISQEVVKSEDMKICYLSGEGRKRGLYHYDSSIFPYIATALFKGKWTINEYPEELSRVFENYKINPLLKSAS